MKERPILFSGPMVRAILDGRKTQSRRTIKPQPERLELSDAAGERRLHWCIEHSDPEKRAAWPVGDAPFWTNCPYGVPGDKLWVRETSIIAPRFWNDGVDSNCTDADGIRRLVQYLASSPNRDAANDYKLKATPSIFMPRWASRISLEITDVRVERLLDTNEADCIAEGVERTKLGPRSDFLALWASINGNRSLLENPWVWALSFKRVSNV